MRNRVTVRLCGKGDVTRRFGYPVLISLATPRNCPHCGQKCLAQRRPRRRAFILLFFSFSANGVQTSESTDMSSALAGGVRVAQRVFVPFVLLAHICCGGVSRYASSHARNTGQRPLQTASPCSHSLRGNGDDKSPTTARQGAAGGKEKTTCQLHGKRVEYRKNRE